MRRRVGVGGIQKKRLEDKKFEAKGDELAQNQVDWNKSINDAFIVTHVSLRLYFTLLD